MVNGNEREQQERKTLQLFYAAALVDSVVNYAENGILEKVAEKKAREQAAAAPAQLKRLGIGDVPSLFKGFSSLFGCVDWEITGTPERPEAVAKSCLMCAIAKQRGSEAPCDMYCINPFKSLTRTLGYTLDVKETLWDGDLCRFSCSPVEK